MNVLSLFDGMSCGQIALDQLGIPVDNYFAAEIDKYAVQVADANYPNTWHLGDVRNVRTQHNALQVMNLKGVHELHNIDLLIGGSPCQGFSFAGRQLNFDDPRSQLFFEYVRLLELLKPKYFLLENVKMKKESEQVITDMLGVEPVEINSNLVSAQNRKRLYWTNIPFDGLPEDRGILLADILEPVENIGDEHYHSMKAVEYMERGNDKWVQAGKRRADRYEQTPDTKKSFTLTANMHKGVPYNYFKDTRSGMQIVGEADIKARESLRRVYDTNGKSPTLMASTGGHTQPKIMQDMTWRKLTPTECERLQTVPDGYTAHVSNTQRYKMLGNGWTVEVIKHIMKGLK
jgi:DNA (cytosine-5)-methyltransferase 3A